MGKKQTNKNKYNENIDTVTSLVERVLTKHLNMKNKRITQWK